MRLVELAFDQISQFLALFLLYTIENHSLKPGTIVTDGKNNFKIACKDGFVSISMLQLEGKNRMNSVEFLRGFKIKDYTIDFS